METQEVSDPRVLPPPPLAAGTPIYQKLEPIEQSETPRKHKKKRKKRKKKDQQSEDFNEMENDGTLDFKPTPRSVGFDL